MRLDLAATDDDAHAHMNMEPDSRNLVRKPGFFLQGPGGKSIKVRTWLNAPGTPAS